MPSICDTCKDPGLCCKRLMLGGVTAESFPTRLEALAIAAAKTLAQVKATMERIPLPHIKVEGADRCPSCGCPVADFDKVPCK